MKIDIKRNGNEYVFLKNEKKLYYAIYSISWFKTKKELFSDKKQKIAEVIPKIGLNGVKYKITLNNYNLTLKLKGSLLKNYYEAFYKNDIYKIIKHKGYYVSIFKNNIQIAYYKTHKTTFNNSEKTQLVCNSDTEETLLITFIVALELTHQEHDEVGSINLGNIALEYKPFNKKWKPI
ncbi:hypothetical protein BTO06_16295 [Tenacibaculum sp. SZ-18]|uniref:hypothetical protein n=1 Tax=Tenacibaculum sp. SZ-18 TaxID=754423 RepID=UPI000C2D0E8F|nr:hypothetical protein [Tenacibaculum sp. SZ-18]AUC16612.1 hypothetical protein BTO06_16295 [Tenacibaculum sp. SZ-18]